MNYYYIFGDNFIVENCFYCVVLVFVYFCWVGEFEDVVIDVCGFNDVVVFCEIIVEYCQVVVFVVGVF